MSAQKIQHWPGPSLQAGAIQIQRQQDYWVGRFQAMSSPCEVLVDIDERHDAKHIVKLAATEAWRIERKFSRYRSDSVIQSINNSRGKAIQLDAESAHLINFAEHCYQLSDALFDITSGVLRRAWKFDGSDNIPAQAQVEDLLPLIGWDKILWDNPFITLPKGMQLDLGGIGKEYAVDRAALLIAQASSHAVLVNFGGDVAAIGTRRDARPWSVGIERPGFDNQAQQLLSIDQGALATSGDARRYLLKDGTRYAHVLNPKTGWPIEGAPRSVTVAHKTCTEAGILATLSLLQGSGAEDFLDQQDVQFWCVR